MSDLSFMTATKSSFTLEKESMEENKTKNKTKTNKNSRPHVVRKHFLLCFNFHTDSCVSFMACGTRASADLSKRAKKKKKRKKEAGEFMNKHRINEGVETTKENALSESCGSLLVRP